MIATVEWPEMRKQCKIYKNVYQQMLPRMFTSQIKRRFITRCTSTPLRIKSNYSAIVKARRQSYPHVAYCLREETLAAGAEEKWLAIENNNFHEGVLIIRVVTQIMGGVKYPTKTYILHQVGRASNTQSKPPEHVYFKRWPSFSQAFESDIPVIVEGFKQTDKVHGLSLQQQQSLHLRRSPSSPQSSSIPSSTFNSTNVSVQNSSPQANPTCQNSSSPNGSVTFTLPPSPIYVPPVQSSERSLPSPVSPNEANMSSTLVQVSNPTKKSPATSPMQSSQASSYNSSTYSSDHQSFNQYSNIEQPNDCSEGKCLPHLTLLASVIYHEIQNADPILAKLPD
ncbi:unnamed protein product [Mytilus coruscus]|uniref:Uncharacterized protein n=1 Tax=Mytilus coruscus TaxID=42192 RepID=A0A6J8BPH7_MYTCO|nr:unnamed protein product [Mytilus coruscus]